MGSPQPAISVILPVYNTERYLGIAIESVLSQTFRDFELLALDDGSTDGSLKLLQRFSAYDSRVRVFHRRNQGIVATANELIAESRGSYVARMDSDDICHPRRFEKQIAYLDAHQECVAVGSAILLIDSDGSPLIPFPCKIRHQDIDNSLLCGAVEIWNPTIMMRKSAIQKIGGYRSQYRHAEDVDFFLRLAEVGKLANLPDVLLEYRQHAASIGYAYRREQLAASRRAAEAAYERRGITHPPSSSNWMVIRQSNADAHRKWAWWALMAGNTSTARKHAFKAVALDPFGLNNLRLLACALRGR